MNDKCRSISQRCRFNLRRQPPPPTRHPLPAVAIPSPDPPGPTQPPAYRRQYPDACIACAANLIAGAVLSLSVDCERERCINACPPVVASERIPDRRRPACWLKAIAIIIACWRQCCAATNSQCCIARLRPAGPISNRIPIVIMAAVGACADMPTVAC